MAGLSTRSTSSRSRSRESFEDTRTNEAKSLAYNEQFMQLLRALPDELVRLQREINILKKETKVSPPRAEENERLKQKVREYERQLQERVNISPRYSRDTESKRIDHEKRLKEQYEIKEKQLTREHQESVLQLRKHYDQQRNNNEETLQKNNTELQNRVKESLHIALQREEENERLKQKVREYERQLQERVITSPRHTRDEERLTQAHLKQALEEKRRELDRFKERHAAFSERRVRSDQRKTENTLSSNRQSQLETEYVTEFKDGTRVDAIEVITTRVGRLHGTKISSSLEYLKCCRLACFIFEIAYEVVLNVKESFATYTSSVLETLAADAPAIGSDNTTFQNKIWKLHRNRPKETLHATEDAVSEVMILVKERAKKHDLNSLVQDVNNSIVTQWNRRHYTQRGQILLDYDHNLLYSLNDYIKYCTQFAWYAVTQVPPLKIDYTSAVYSSRSHTVNQAFNVTEERSPTRRSVQSESRNILCYLWPTLQDCDGKVIRKGEVILNR